MPFYVYRCACCGKELEVLQHMDALGPFCVDWPDCPGPMVKELTTASFKIDKAAG
jgi:putative FmdB family regulatory protein